MLVVVVAVEAAFVDVVEVVVLNLLNRDNNSKQIFIDSNNIFLTRV